MKQRFLHLTVLFLFIISGRTSLYSQVSEGGLPPSFTYPDISLRSATVQKPVVRVQPAAKIADLLFEDAQRELDNLPLRAGILIPVELDINKDGTWQVLPDGQRIWTLNIQADGAFGISLYYDDFYIPEGGKLFIYNAEKTHILGAYTSRTTKSDRKKFATELVAGDDIILEYVAPLQQEDRNTVPADNVEKARITISRVGYGYNYLKVVAPDENDLRNIGSSSSCMININCPEGRDWQNQKRGVASTLTPIGQGLYLCSGTIINNTRNNGDPLYLSASHCFNDNDIKATVEQMIFYFHYEHPGCDDLTQIPATVRTMSGAEMLVDLPIDGASDGSLLRLLENIPVEYEIYYNGWDRSSTPATSGVGIHHPSGDAKKISVYSAPAVSTSWNGSDGSVGALNAHWNVIFVETESGHGVTEGGSSGSPLFNQNGLVVGTLSGGNSTCTNLSGRNLYGKLWYHWDQIAGATNQMAQYLDPDNTGQEVLQGMFYANEAFADFRVSQDAIFTGESVLFTDQSYNADTYNWTFEDGQPATFIGKDPPLVIFSTPGDKTVKLIINEGTAKQQEKTITISVFEQPGVEVPVADFAFDRELVMREDFEESFATIGWTVENIGASTTVGWMIARFNGDALNYTSIDPTSVRQAMAQFDNINNVDSWLISPAETLSTLSILEFYVAYQKQNLDGEDNTSGVLSFHISTDGGSTWTEKWSTLDEMIPREHWAWRKKSFNLAGYAGQEVLFAWRFNGIGGYYAGLDGVKLYDYAMAPSQVTIQPGQSIEMYDLSTGIPSSWEWTFDGGDPATSTSAHPGTITYHTEGTYDITLKVQNSKGNNEKILPNAVTVTSIAPVAAFEIEGGYTRLNYGSYIPAGESLDFTDLSTNYPMEWQWTFDGATPPGSTNQHVSGVTYPTEGEYTFQLEVTNAAGSDQIRIEDAIKVGGESEKIWNMLYGEEGNSIYTHNNGYVTGSNTDYDMIYAERFEAPAGKGIIIESVDIMFYVQSVTGGSLTVTVYNESGGYPGAAIQSFPLSLENIKQNEYTTVLFPQPVAVDGAFYIGVSDFSDYSDYMIAINTSEDRGSGNKNTAYVYNYFYAIFMGQGWFSMEEMYSDIGLSLNIVPQVSYAYLELEGDRKHTFTNIDERSGSVSVKTNSSWIATSENDWIEFIDAGGVGDGSFSFTVKDNHAAPRRGLINVSAPGGAFATYVLVEQAGASVTEFSASVLNKETGEVALNWNIPAGSKGYEPGDNIFDGAEDHRDFVINSAGYYGWSYIDGDASPLYGIDGVTYTNNMLPAAFIVFNPANTTPAANATFDPYVGRKYFASFAAENGPNNDWMISPELGFDEAFTFSFWAKSYTDQYGLERLRVAYSTTGNDMTDFTEVLTSGSYASVPTDWTQYSYTIPAEAKYVAINCVSDDAFILMVDDIFIGTGDAPQRVEENTGITFEDAQPYMKRSRTSGINAAPMNTKDIPEADMQRILNRMKKPVHVKDETTGTELEIVRDFPDAYAVGNSKGSKLQVAHQESSALRAALSSLPGAMQTYSGTTKIMTLRWDNGENYTAIGVADGADIEVAIKFTPQDLLNYHGTVVKALDIFIRELPATGITLKIRQGESLIHTQLVTSLTPQAYNRIELDSEIAIDAIEDMCFGYSFTQNPGNYVPGCDRGPAVSGKGDLIAIADDPFEPMSALGLNYNWNIAVVMEVATEELEYHLYRNGDPVTSTSMTSYTDYIPVGLTEVAYQLAVSYKGGLTSVLSDEFMVYRYGIITFGSMDGKVYGHGDFLIDVEHNEGWEFTVESDDPDVVSVYSSADGWKAKIHAAGTVTLKAYTDEVEASQELVVDKARLMIELADIEVYYTGSPVSVFPYISITGSPVAGSLVCVVEYEGINGTSYSKQEIAPTAPGSYEVSTTVIGDNNHYGASHKSRLTILGEIPVGTESINSNNIAVYPTITTHKIYVQILHESRVEIISISGQKVKDVKLATSDYVDVSDLSNGIYLVRIVSGDETIVIRIIKK